MYNIFVNIAVTAERKKYMKRRIINIDKDKCDGCGLCVQACHEGAIVLKDGKAELMRDDYCDGLGDCLPVCPAGAITFIEREAAEYDAAAVEENKKRKNIPLTGGCPGSRAMAIDRNIPDAVTAYNPSQLRQWPVQIKLVPTNAQYFNGADLLVAADCTAYAYGNFHNEIMRKKITVIGCPKLDSVDYTEKLTAIISENDIKSLTVVKMEVPCCKGIENAAVTALKNSGKFIPWQVITISTDGKII